MWVVNDIDEENMGGSFGVGDRVGSARCRAYGTNFASDAKIVVGKSDVNVVPDLCFLSCYEGTA